MWGLKPATNQISNWDQRLTSTRQTIERIFAWVGILAIAGYTACASAQELRREVETADTVTVTDWEQGFVDVTGSATARFTGNRVQEELMAKAAARLVAQARLVEILRGIRVTGKTTVEKFVVADQRIGARLEGFVKGAITLTDSLEWRADPAADRGEVPLAMVKLRLCITRSHALCRQRSSSLIGALQEPHATTRVAKKAKVAVPPKRYTGLIVDLENELFLPVLLPEIVTWSGTVVYGRDQVDNGILAQHGMARYTRTILQAKDLTLVGKAPLIVKAVAVTDDNKIVISDADAAIIGGVASQAGNFLADARVAIALD